MSVSWLAGHQPLRIVGNSGTQQALLCEACPDPCSLIPSLHTCGGGCVTPQEVKLITAAPAECQGTRRYGTFRVGGWVMVCAYTSKILTNGFQGIKRPYSRARMVSEIYKHSFDACSWDRVKDINRERFKYRCYFHLPSLTLHQKDLYKTIGAK